MASENAPKKNRISREISSELKRSFASFAALRPHLWLALGVFAGTFALFLATKPAGAVPGLPAETLECLAGLRPDTATGQSVWRGFMRLVCASAPAGALVARAAAACAAVSALGAAALCLAISQLVFFLFDREQWALAFKRNPLTEVNFVSGLAGLGAAVALATSAPYWTTAAQAWPHAFYLSWFLLAVFFLLRHAIAGGRGSFAAFCLLYGAGLSQASVFLAHLPLVGLFLLWAMWNRRTLSVRSVISAALLAAIPAFALLFAGASAFAASDAAVLAGGRYTTLSVARQVAQALVNGVFGALPRAWWLILIGLTVLPWLAILLVARRAVNAERGPALEGLLIAVATTTFCVLLDLRFSPWQFYHEDSLQIVPYAMTAATFGLLVARLGALALARPDAALARKTALRLAVLAAIPIPVEATVALIRNADDADASVHEYAWRYADRALDALEGRGWLFTNGPLDANLRLRASERRLDAKVVNLASDFNGPALAALLRELPGVELRNAANVGPLALLREWIGRRPHADREIALAALPDFWHLGPYEDVPSGPIFLGRPAEADNPEDLDAASETALALLKEMGPVLDRVGPDRTFRVRIYAAHVRQRISQAANNVGVLLEAARRDAEAWLVLRDTGTFDPDNVSCLLNRVSLFRKGLHPEEKDEIEAALNALRNKLKQAEFDVRGSLASMFGYVSSPGAFLDLGWRWALSGMSTLAINSFHRAIDAADPEQQAGMRTLLADVYRRSGDFEASEAAYLAVLAEDPGVPEALLGLVRICVLRGDFDAAKEHLEQARAAGVPEDRLLFETAAAQLAAGDTARAEAAAQRLREFDPEGPRALVLLSLVHGAAFEAAVRAGDNDAREAAREALRSVVDELVRISGPDDFQALFVRGRASVLQGHYAEARDDFLAALRNCPGPERVSVLGSVLQMDYALLDRAAAERHAKDVLTLAPEHVFANYILGSVMLSRERFESAESYLARALSADPDYLPARNDIAMARLRLGKLDEAEADARRVLAADGNFPTAWDTLGLVLLERGNVDGARSAFETALQLDDEDPRIPLHAALALRAAGLLDKAREQMEELYGRAGAFTGKDARDWAELVRVLGR